MFIIVKTITDEKTPQPYHGKKLAKLARECIVENLPLNIDFEDINAITSGFARELFLPLVLEFGAECIKNKLHLTNLSPNVLERINASFSNLDEYFEQLSKAQNKNCDEEIYELNLFWLVKARELARENTLNAHLMMGIAEEEMRLALSKLAIEDIHRIARCGWLCFSPRFTSSFIQEIADRQFDADEVLLALSGTLC